MKRTGTAVWHGGLRDGGGAISTDSKTLSDAQYSLGTRIEQGGGTNPEELLAAAHAGCFTMALTAQLGEANLTAESINTTASMSLEKRGSEFVIPSVHLEVRAKIPGADEAAFLKAAETAKTNCPVSKLFNAEITMNAQLEA